MTRSFRKTTAELILTGLCFILESVFTTYVCLDASLLFAIDNICNASFCRIPWRTGHQPETSKKGQLVVCCLWTEVNLSQTYLFVSPINFKDVVWATVVFWKIDLSSGNGLYWNRFCREHDVAWRRKEHISSNKSDDIPRTVCTFNFAFLNNQNICGAEASGSETLSGQTCHIRHANWRNATLLKEKFQHTTRVVKKAGVSAKRQIPLFYGFSSFCSRTRSPASQPKTSGLFRTPRHSSGGNTFLFAVNVLDNVDLSLPFCFQPAVTKRKRKRGSKIKASSLVQTYLSFLFLGEHRY